MKHNRQKGFSALAVIAIVAVLAAVSLIGWYVWNKNKKTEPGKTTTSQTTQNKQTDPSEGGKYLVIKEWGVRFPLPEELRGDVTYGIATLEPDNTQIVRFEINSIAQLP